MKIVLINSDYASGSTGRIVQHIKNKLEQDGHDCLAFFGRDNSSKDKNVIRIGLSKIHVYLHVIVTRLFDLQGFASFFPTLVMIYKLHKFSPDLIHLHNLHGSYLNIGILFRYLKKINVPIVYTLHDCWSFTGHCCLYSSIQCEKWKSQCFNCPIHMSYPKSYLDLSKFNYIRKKSIECNFDNLVITTVSDWLAAEVSHSFLNKYPKFIIHNGIDVDVFKNVPSSLREELGFDNKIVLLSVASIWSPSKGAKMLENIINSLNDNYHLVVIGAGAKSYFEKYDKVTFVDRTENINELVLYYSMADIFLNTSCEETFGLVSLEALACGTPLVTNNLTANPELVDDCGVIVDKYTCDYYVSAIENFDFKRFSSEKCRNRALKYDETIGLNKYFKLYRSLI